MHCKNRITWVVLVAGAIVLGLPLAGAGWEREDVAPNRRSPGRIDPASFRSGSTPELGVRLDLNDEMFEAGEDFRLHALCYGGEQSRQADLYIVLDVFGERWLWPCWEQVLCFDEITLTGGEVSVQSILELVWPENVGAATGLLFWGGMVDPSTEVLIGQIDMVEFGYE